MERRISIIILCSILIFGIYGGGLAKIPNPNQRPRNTAPSVSSPSSMILANMKAAPFQEIMNAYRSNDLPLAITKAKEIEQQRQGRVSETAAFIVGELYLKQADQGGEEAIPQAMLSFQKAITTYPKSMYVPFGYMMIGRIYARQKLFYEAVGSFNRILKRPARDQFTLKAKIEIANTYQAWGKWPYAKATYAMVLNENPLPFDDKRTALFGYADALYQMGQFEMAYQHYKEAAALMTSYRFQNPIALFQFAEAAYQTGHVDLAKKLFLDFYNIHPGEPLAPVALIRAKTLFSQEEKRSKQPFNLAAPAFSSVDNTFQTFISKSVRGKANDGVHLGKILLSVERLKGCTPFIPPKHTMAGLFISDNGVHCGMPLGQAAFSPSIRQSHLDRQAIQIHAMQLLTNAPPSTTSLGVLKEAVDQLKQYKEVETIVQIEATSLLNLPPFSPYRAQIQRTLEETITKQLGTIVDPMTIITLYHTYAQAFTKEMLKNEPGFVIAMSHLQVGLFSHAAGLLRPISENYKHPLSDEALYQFGQVSLALGNDEDAKVALLQYQQRSPRDRHRVLVDLGDIFFRQNEIDQALLYYQNGLRHRSNQPNRGLIMGKIADVYRFRNDFETEIKTYLQWIKETPNTLNLPYLRLADAYIQSTQYRKGIEAYQVIVSNPQSGKAEIEWAQLRMAISYELLGDFDEGDRLYNILLKAKTPLIRKMAEEHLHPNLPPPPIQKEAIVPTENGHI